MTNLRDDLAEVVRLWHKAEEENVYGTAESFGSAHRAFQNSATCYIAEHAAEIERNARDAERYRWLRDNGKPAAEGLVMRNPAHWDIAIDDAMRGGVE